MSGSVPSHTSTSSSITTPPIRASNSSDVIHPAILGPLYGWLLTLTSQVSISGMSGLITRSILFICESLEISTSWRNTVGVDDRSRRFSGADFIPPPHTIYGYLTGLLLTLTEIKYQGSSTNPFSEHPILMMLFLIAIFVYGVALTITLRRSNHDEHYSGNKLMVGVSHICGGLACELLLLLLVSPTQSLLINVCTPTLIVMLVSCFKYLRRSPHSSPAEGTEISQTGGGDQEVDLEA